MRSVKGSRHDQPCAGLALRASYAEIKEPEAMHPGHDEKRYTVFTRISLGG